MKFKEVIIYNWYDNVISAFCKTDENIIYYCNVVVMNDQQVEKIYICIELKYFLQADILFRMVKDNTFLENEEVIHEALNNVQPYNESFLVITNNLLTGSLESIKYKSDFNWNHNFFSVDFITGLEISAKLDDWWGYFKS